MTTSQSSNGEVAQAVLQIRQQLEKSCRECGRDPQEVRLMAVTKTVDPQRVNEAIAAGVTLLGENKAQELCAKYDQYQKDGVEIHFIGHLQTNKVKQIIDKVCMIQSLDSIALAQEIQKQCEKHDRTMDCLVEVNIGNEANKSGVLPEELEDFLVKVSGFSRIHVRGLMSIPPVCEINEEIEQYFCKMQKLFVDIKAKKLDNIHMDFLSMGMSGDYPLAVKYGSTMVRIGTAMFGHRNYT